MRLVVVGIALGCFASWSSNANASLAYSLPGSTYTQNFDSLASTPQGTPPYHPWTNDSTIPSWNLFRVTSGSPYNATPTAVDSFDAGSGIENFSQGRYMSFGAPNSSERALGAVGSTNFAGATSVLFGNTLGWIATNITNNTGGSLPQFTVAFNGEQWRDAGNHPDDVPVNQTMVFEYGFGSSFTSVSSWTAPGGNFDWTSPVATVAGGAVNGNAAGLVAGRGGTINNLNWADGQTLWLRWIEYNDAGADHGLAIDNFSFSAGAAAVPEPGAYLFGILICGVIGLALTARKFLSRRAPQEATVPVRLFPQPQDGGTR